MPNIILLALHPPPSLHEVAATEDDAGRDTHPSPLRMWWDIWYLWRLLQGRYAYKSSIICYYTMQ